MITIDGKEYTEEELSVGAKIRANRIKTLQEELVEWMLAQQEAEQNIRFHAQQIKEEMEPPKADEEFIAEHDINLVDE